MNKAFKVLWNDVRRSYVVSSEAQMSHGKPARSSKTLVAAAVAGVLALGASSAFAALPTGPITNDNLPTIGENGRDTTKLVSGQGNVVNIQTNGSLATLKDRLEKALSMKDDNGQPLGKIDTLKEIIKALGPVKDGSTDHVVITGVTGGNNVMNKIENGIVSSTIDFVSKSDLGTLFGQQFSHVIKDISRTEINIGDNFTSVQNKFLATFFSGHKKSISESFKVLVTTHKTEGSRYAKSNIIDVCANCPAFASIVIFQTRSKISN